MTRPLLEVADVVRQYGADYLSPLWRGDVDSPTAGAPDRGAVPHGDAGWPQSPV